MSTLEKIEKTTKRASFIVEPNSKYLVTERPIDGTPDGLRAKGRSKMGGGFYEPLPLPWLDSQGRYDTGLNEFSPEFAGKSQTEITKILKERKVLADHLDFLVKSSGLSETDFLAGADITNSKGEVVQARESYRLNVTHGSILDTSSKDTYLKLFLTLRGNALMPKSESGNLGKYGGAMYQIEGVEAMKENKYSEANLQAENVAWLISNYEVNKKRVFDTLVYVGLMEVRQEKDRGVLADLLLSKTLSFTVIENLHNAIKNVDYDDIKNHVKVKEAIASGKIKRDKKGYSYDEHYLGSDVNTVVKKLMLPEHQEAAITILSDKQKK